MTRPPLTDFADVYRGEILRDLACVPLWCWTCSEIEFRVVCGIGSSPDGIAIDEDAMRAIVAEAKRRGMKPPTVRHFNPDAPVGTWEHAAGLVVDEEMPPISGAIASTGGAHWVTAAHGRKVLGLDRECDDCKHGVELDGDGNHREPYADDGYDRITPCARLNPPEKPDGSTATDADRAAGYNADDVTAFRERFEPVEQARAAYLRGEGRRWQRIGGQLHDLERGPDGLLVRR